MRYISHRFIYLLRFLLGLSDISFKEEETKFYPENPEEEKEYNSKPKHNCVRAKGSTIITSIKRTKYDLKKLNEFIVPVSFFIEAENSFFLTNKFREYYRVLEYFWSSEKGNNRDKYRNQPDKHSKNASALNNILGTDEVTSPILEDYKELRDRCSHSVRNYFITILDEFEYPKLEKPLSKIKFLAKKLINKAADIK